MIKLKPIKHNQNVITVPNGSQILFSYETPVAIISANGYNFITEQFHSVTTSRHINRFMQSLEYKKVSQDSINNYATTIVDNSSKLV